MDPTTLKPGDIIDGYKFEGWFLDPEFTQAYDFMQPLLGNTTLYAKWSRVGVTSPKTSDTSLLVVWTVLFLAFLVGFAVEPILFS